MGIAKMDLVSNPEASPPVFTEAVKDKGKKRIRVSNMELATGDLDTGDIVYLCRLKSNESVLSIKLFTDELDGGSGLVTDVGLYNLDGTAADIDVYADGSTALQSAVAGTDFAFVTRDYAKMGQQVWQDAGASVDGGGEYYLALTFATGAGTAQAGTLAIQVETSIE